MNKYDEIILSKLQNKIRARAEILSKSYYNKKIQEIRLRAERASSICFDGHFIPLGITLSYDDINENLYSLSSGSLYAYEESIRHGFFTLENGVRVGVCGRAVCENGHIISVAEISSLSIRIAHKIDGAGSYGVNVFNKKPQNILVYSKPGIGKTTFLRDMAIQLSQGKNFYRVAIIDEREEFCPSLIPDKCHIDVLSGYPKGVGIEIATRTLSPDIIVCDEIGAGEEKAISFGVSSGVFFFASAHSDSLEALLMRGTVKYLSLNKIFGAYIGIKKDEIGNYSYTSDYLLE